VSTPKARAVRLRAYNVGFGDCFLITVTYRDDSRRHVLVDCGSTKMPSRRRLATVVQAVAEETHKEGIATAIVTHRHQDHVSGFSSNARSRTTIAALQPKLLIRPWMDAPTGQDGGSRSIGAASRHFSRALTALDSLVTEAGKLAAPRGDLQRLIKMQVAAAGADATLTDWGRDARTKTWYVQAGMQRSLGSVLPDASIEFIGPPTLEQVPFLASYLDKEPEQFWIGAAHPVDELHRRLGWKLGDRMLDRLSGDDRFGTAAWLARELSTAQRETLLATAKSFDRALNNTSVVAILTIGDRRLLLAGDAQIENWTYTLARLDRLDDVLLKRFGDVRPPAKNDDFAKRLAAVDVYKVGHHGSKNATPKSLLQFWNERTPRQHELVAVMSTIPGFHGERRNDGEVPRSTLVRALIEQTTAYSTHCLDPDDDTFWLDLTADAHGGGTFTGRRGQLTNRVPRRHVVG
jgi:ribonuclease BN (tRNA processing enzyme)